MTIPALHGTRAVHRAFSPMYHVPAMRGRHAHARDAVNAIRARFGPSILTAFRNREHVHTFTRIYPDEEDRQLGDAVAKALEGTICYDYGCLMELAEAGEWETLREEARDWMGFGWSGPHGIFKDIQDTLARGPGEVCEELLDFLLQRDLFQGSSVFDGMV